MVEKIERPELPERCPSCGAHRDSEYAMTTCGRYHTSNTCPMRAAAYWERIATERLRVLWIIARGCGGRFAIGKSVAEEYPGDDVAIVLTHTDPQFGDLIIEASDVKKRGAENLNPTAEAVAAMYVFSYMYAAQKGGSMDFWHSLTDREKKLCAELVERVRKADRAHRVNG